MAASNRKTSIHHLGTGESYDGLHGNEVSVYAEQIVSLIAFPMAMNTAIELDLFKIIAGAEGSGRGRISAAAIADQLRASDKDQAADMLERMLRLLASFAVVTCSVDGGGHRVYGLSPVGRCFVEDEDGVCFGPLMSLVQDQVFLASWSKLKESILEGGNPFTKANGLHVFDYLRMDPRFNNVFNKAMFSHTTVVIKKVLQHYNGFDTLQKLVDVAGGLGHTLKIIVSKYPTIKGINFDLPHVIKHALTTQGIEHVAGDMFESVPGPAEAIFMKWILHDWSDENCIKLLKNCYNALPSHGKVIVLEHVLANDDEFAEMTIATKATRQWDLSMMTQCPGGRERTKSQFIALAKAAGFNSINFACNVCGFWIMEFFK